MRFAKSFAHGVAGVALLLLIIAGGMVVCDERCSRDVSANDIVWHELESGRQRPPGFTQDSPLFPLSGDESTGDER